MHVDPMSSPQKVPVEFSTAAGASHVLTAASLDWRARGRAGRRMCGIGAILNLDSKPAAAACAWASS